jgi:hypothetical protein
MPSSVLATPDAEGDLRLYPVSLDFPEDDQVSWKKVDQEWH